MQEKNLTMLAIFIAFRLRFCSASSCSRIRCSTARTSSSAFWRFSDAASSASDGSFSVP